MEYNINFLNVCNIVQWVVNCIVFRVVSRKENNNWIGQYAQNFCFSWCLLFWRRCPFEESLVPLFGTYALSCKLGWSLHLCLTSPVHVRFLIFTSGATAADILAASMVTQPL